MFENLRSSGSYLIDMSDKIELTTAVWLRVVVRALQFIRNTTQI